MTATGDPNACRHCDERIYFDKWGIWRHYETGLMLCVPNEDDPNFTGVEGAEPLYTDEEIDAFT